MAFSLYHLSLNLIKLSKVAFIMIWHFLRIILAAFHERTQLACMNDVIRATNELDGLVVLYNLRFLNLLKL